MKKALQLGINDICLAEMDKVNADIENGGIARVSRLRTCNAKVYETANYYVLVSYSTAVAFIRKSDSTLFDVLRYVYGYTSTSAQHISKFRHDFSGYDCIAYTYR